MFAGQPQPVEIHHRGIWYSGELIGWRHETDGRVTARVRCRVDGLRHSAWMDLGDLRLPDPRHPPHKEPFPAVVRRPTLATAQYGARADTRDEDDATRPHVMLAAMRARPAKPTHAVQPPLPGSPVPPPAPEGAPAVEPPAPGEPAPVRRNQHLRRREAYLSDG